MTQHAMGIYNISCGYRGVAQFGLERHLGVVEAAGSNPVAPTSLVKKNCLKQKLWAYFFVKEKVII